VAVAIVGERAQKAEGAGDVVVGDHQRHVKPLVDVVVDFAQFIDDLGVVPAFDWSAQEDADQLAKNARVNALYVVGSDSGRACVQGMTQRRAILRGTFQCLHTSKGAHEQSASADMCRPQHGDSLVELVLLVLGLLGHGHLRPTWVLVQPQRLRPVPRWKATGQAAPCVLVSRAKRRRVRHVSKLQLSLEIFTPLHRWPPRCYELLAPAGWGSTPRHRLAGAAALGVALTDIEILP